jgi:hypothetical protein
LPAACPGCYCISSPPRSCRQCSARGSLRLTSASLPYLTPAPLLVSTRITLDPVMEPTLPQMSVDRAVGAWCRRHRLLRLASSHPLPRHRHMYGSTLSWICGSRLPAVRPCARRCGSSRLPPQSAARAHLAIGGAPPLVRPEMRWV